MFERSQTILGARFATLALAWVIGGCVSVLLGGCGQKGPLYIPRNDPAAAQRATLPQALLNTVRSPQTPQPPASTASGAAAGASGVTPAASGATSVPPQAASAPDAPPPDWIPPSPSALPDVRANP